MSIRTNKPLLLALGCILLTSCSSARDVLSINRSTPDEFKVISNPPLSLPPDFALRPPVKAGNKASSTELKAKELLFENTSSDRKVSTSNVLSSAEKKFLERSGAERADPNIKALIEEEYRQTLEAQKKKGILKKVLSYTQGDEGGGQDPVINASKEKKRLEDGASPNESDVETEAKGDNKEKKGLLNRVIGF